MKKINKYKIQYNLIVNFIVYIIAFSPLILLGMAILADLADDALLNRLAAIMIISTISMFYFIYRERNVLKCIVGEAVTKFIINKYCHDSGYVNIHGLILENSKSGYTQIDQLIITPKGIIVLKTQSFVDYEISGHEYYNTWTYTKIIKDKNKDKEKSKIESKIQKNNPMKENYADIQKIKELLNDESIRYYNIVAYIDTVKIKKCDIVNKNSMCVYANDLPKTIEEIVSNNENEKIDINKLKEIICKLQKINITDKNIRKEYIRANAYRKEKIKIL